MIKKTILSAIILSFVSFGQVYAQHPLDNMPLVHDESLHVASSASPQPKRDESVRKYLKVSLRIINGNVSGSGTICYYDKSKNEAYIITCGHLWSGRFDSRKDGAKKCRLEVWYHNETKLPKSQFYDADIICYVAPNAGNDIGFLKFKPDWVIDQYYPIAPMSYPIHEGEAFESCGCDQASEVSAYTVKILREENKDLITRENSPRPGRSGGGLLTKDGYYIGICWGTSDYAGTGIGYFVPLSRIHPFAKEHGLDWILNVAKDSLANKIPIKDLTDKQGDYDSNYVPLP